MTSNGPRRIAGALAILAAAGCSLVEPAPRAALEPSPAAPQESAGGKDPGADVSDPVEAFRKLLGSMGVRLDLAARTVEVDGWVNLQRGLVEVFACAPEGKTHEAVVVLDCVPSALNAALLALDLKPAPPPAEGAASSEAYRPGTGSKVHVYVRWKDEAGKPRRARAEEWVWEKEGERPMRRTAWVYTGSFLQRSPALGEEATYAADYIKTLVATYNDPTAVIDNPHQEGADDRVYYVNEKAVPAPRTKVTAVFSPVELAE